MDDTFTNSLLSALRFADKRDEDVDYSNSRSGVILEGNACDRFNFGRTLKACNWEEYPEDLQLYLNCDGQLINGCDWSYDSQKEREDIQLCTLDNFEEWLKEYKRILNTELV